MEFSLLPENYREMRLSPYKKDFYYSYVFGVFPVMELAGSLPSALFRIAISTKLSDDNRKMLCRVAASLDIPISEDDRAIDRLSPKENCFAVGVFRKFKELPDPGEDHIVLVNPSDKGNLGGILRSAVAFGFHDIAIVSPAADLFDPHTVRSSMGALFRVRPFYFQTFEEYASLCGARNFYPFMLKGSPMENAGVKPGLPSTLIFGNESSGLSDSYLCLGTPLRITHSDEVDSLNLSVAAAIGMHWFRNEVRS